MPNPHPTVHYLPQSLDTIGGFPQLLSEDMRKMVLQASTANDICLNFDARKKNLIPRAASINECFAFPKPFTIPSVGESVDFCFSRFLSPNFTFFLEKIKVCLHQKATYGCIKINVWDLGPSQNTPVNLVGIGCGVPSNFNVPLTIQNGTDLISNALDQTDLYMSATNQVAIIEPLTYSIVANSLIRFGIQFAEGDAFGLKVFLIGWIPNCEGSKTLNPTYSSESSSSSRSSWSFGIDLEASSESSSSSSGVIIEPDEDNSSSSDSSGPYPVVINPEYPDLLNDTQYYDYDELNGAGHRVAVNWGTIFDQGAGASFECVDIMRSEDYVDTTYRTIKRLYNRLFNPSAPELDKLAYDDGWWFDTILSDTTFRKQGMAIYNYKIRARLNNQVSPSTVIRTVSVPAAPVTNISLTKVMRNESWVHELYFEYLKLTDMESPHTISNFSLNRYFYNNSVWIEDYTMNIPAASLSTDSQKSSYTLYDDNNLTYDNPNITKYKYTIVANPTNPVYDSSAVKTSNEINIH